MEVCTASPIRIILSNTHGLYFVDSLLTYTAVSFLMRNHFDFGQTLSHGIPYLSRDEAKTVQATLLGENKTEKTDMDVKSEDDALVKHIRATVAEWLQRPPSARESYLNIPSEDRGKGVPGVLNKYQIRLTHQIVNNEFPGMKTTSMRHFVQITDPAHPENQKIAAFQLKEVEREVSRATGFRWLLEALVGGDITHMPDNYLMAALPREIKPSKEGISPLTSFLSDLNQRLRQRRRVLVGHNCFTDLIYLLRFFDGHLPDSVQEFQERVHELFPAVIDTKKLASFGSGRWRDTSLEYVEEEMRFEDKPIAIVPPEFDRYSVNDMQHEAGYDSLLTAKIAIKLSAKLEREGLYLEEAMKADHTHSDHFGEPQGYVTADQSVHDTPSVKADVQEAGRADATTSKASESEPGSLLGTESQQPNTQATASVIVTADTNSINSLPSETSDTLPAVVAVKEKKPKTTDRSKPVHVEQVRSTFASSTIYDVLNRPAEKETIDEKGYDADSDLMSFSDTEPTTDQETTVIEETSDSIDTMVKNGHLMPRWDKSTFWAEFGNKLQVNGCKEETCEL